MYEFSITGQYFREKGNGDKKTCFALQNPCKENCIRPPRVCQSSPPNILTQLLTTQKKKIVVRARASVCVWGGGGESPV